MLHETRIWAEAEYRKALTAAGEKFLAEGHAARFEQLLTRIDELREIVRVDSQLAGLFQREALDPTRSIEDNMASRELAQEKCRRVAFAQEQLPRLHSQAARERKTITDALTHAIRDAARAFREAHAMRQSEIDEEIKDLIAGEIQRVAGGLIEEKTRQGALAAAAGAYGVVDDIISQFALPEPPPLETPTEQRR